MADLEGVQWVQWNPSFEGLPSLLLVSLRANVTMYAGKQIYGELARSTAIGLLHAQLTESTSSTDFQRPYESNS